MHGISLTLQKEENYKIIFMYAFFSWVAMVPILKSVKQWDLNMCHGTTTKWELSPH